jgi:hypothetical protein
MNHPLEVLRQWVKELGAGWAGHAALGSFAVYVLGYLALRFHLMSFGVMTDLDVLDERYLFAGARFIAYMAATLPSLVLLLLPVALAWAGLRRIMPAALHRPVAWLAAPHRLAWIGLLWAVGWTQLVMRKCWALSNLLLAERLPPLPSWLQHLLLDPELMPLYFIALVAACAGSLALLLPLCRLADPPPMLRRARGLLLLLVAIQWLLLPVNYGMLVVDKTLPRVAAAGPRALADGETAWLVWEGKKGLTFLVRNADGRRSLLTHGHEQVSSVEVLGSDLILPQLFNPAGERRAGPAAGAQR